VLHKATRRLRRALHMKDSALDAHFLVIRSTKFMSIHRLIDKENVFTQLNLYFEFQKGNLMNVGNKYSVDIFIVNNSYNQIILYQYSAKQHRNWSLSLNIDPATVF